MILTDPTCLPFADPITSDSDGGARDAGLLAEHRALLERLDSSQAAAFALVYMATDNRIASGHIIKGSAETFMSDLLTQALLV
eukprot:4030571-Amphidinium_carterae.1